MAGFEVVVRPVVFPDIRPRPAQPVPPADDPEKGFATIRGNGGKEFTMSNSYSATTSSGKQREIQRRVDVARVYQKEDGGSTPAVLQALATSAGRVNKDNFVDIEVTNKMWMSGGFGPGVWSKTNPEQKKQSKTNERWVLHYKRQGAQDNIKILQRDKIVKNEDRT